MSDIGLPWWLMLFLPFVASPGWALVCFVAVGGLTYRWIRPLKYGWLIALAAATVASGVLPTVGLLFRDAGLPAIASGVIGLGIALIVFYLRSGPRSAR